MFTALGSFRCRKKLECHRLFRRPGLHRSPWDPTNFKQGDSALYYIRINGLEVNLIRTIS